MSSKCLQRSVQKGLFAVNYKYLYRSYSSVSNLQKQYIAPTYEQIEEYTQNIASVLLSWPAENREYFIATLHKAQANPRRNKNYDSLLTNVKIPETQMKFNRIMTKIPPWADIAFGTFVKKLCDYRTFVHTDMTKFPFELNY